MSEVKRFKASDLHVACCGDTIVVNAEDFDAQRLRADTAEAENRILRHSNASFLETVAKVCDLLGIDLEDAKHADGQPSDVLFVHAKKQAEKLAAAEQRIAFLSDVERVTMAILGKDKDPAPGINWFCNRAWTVNEVREIVRAALNPNPESARELWLDMGELPDHKEGALYRMILDDVPQVCKELELHDGGKRWFYGEENGAFPEDEIQAWLPINPNPEVESHE